MCLFVVVSCLTNFVAVLLIEDVFDVRRMPPAKPMPVR